MSYLGLEHTIERKINDFRVHIKQLSLDNCLKHFGTAYNKIET